MLPILKSCVWPCPRWMGREREGVVRVNSWPPGCQPNALTLDHRNRNTLDLVENIKYCQSLKQNMPYFFSVTCSPIRYSKQKMHEKHMGCTFVLVSKFFLPVHCWQNQMYDWKINNDLIKFISMTCFLSVTQNLRAICLIRYCCLFRYSLHCTSGNGVGR